MIVTVNMMLSTILCLAHSNGNKGPQFVQANIINGEEVISLDLEPASSLLHRHSLSHSSDAKEHGRRLSGRDGNTDMNDTADSNDSNASTEVHAPLLMPSMHPYNSAVYSSLVELDIMSTVYACPRTVKLSSRLSNIAFRVGS